MTIKLKTAFAAAARLPEGEQDALSRLGDETLAEHLHSPADLTAVGGYLKVWPDWLDSSLLSLAKFNYISPAGGGFDKLDPRKGEERLQCSPAPRLGARAAGGHARRPDSRCGGHDCELRLRAPARSTPAHRVPRRVAAGEGGCGKCIRGPLKLRHLPTRSRPRARHRSRLTAVRRALSAQDQCAVGAAEAPAGCPRHGLD